MSTPKARETGKKGSGSKAQQINSPKTADKKGKASDDKQNTASRKPKAIDSEEKKRRQDAKEKAAQARAELEQ